MDSVVIQLPGPVASFLSAMRTDEGQLYLRSYGAEPWCFLTANDPDGEALSDAENEKRTRQVVERVRLLGCWVVTRPSSDCPSWFPEGGILIVGIAEPEAHLLGRDLGQNAIVMGDRASRRILYDTPEGEVRK